MLPAGEVLNQAHQHQVLLGGLNDDRRDFGLAQRLVCFQAALPAAEYVAGLRRPRLCSRATVIGFFKPDWAMLATICLNFFLPRVAGIGHRDLVDRNHLHRQSCFRFMLPPQSFLRLAMSGEVVQSVELVGVQVDAVGFA